MDEQGCYRSPPCSRRRGHHSTSAWKQGACRLRKWSVAFGGPTRAGPTATRQEAEGANMRKSKGVVIHGVRFRTGEVDWEDAHSATREKLPDFDALRQGRQYAGTKVTSTGLIAKVGKYLLVITEKDEALTEFDYTLIPLRPKIQIRYH